MGAKSMLYYFPEKNTTIIILSNVGNTSLDDFAFAIHKQLVK